MEIPEIGFGTYRLGDKTYDSVIYSIKNAGYRHIDTAPLYKNEETVGNAIRDCGIDRKQIFVTTKISRKQLETNSITESIENSLKIMGLDYLDLVLLHEPIDFIENWDILSEYYQTKAKNKIRYIGVSNFNEKQLESLNKISKTYSTPYCNQIELNPFIKRDSIVSYCDKNNIKIVAHSPLAKGEKLGDPSLNKISLDKSITPAQAMLCWNLYQNNTVIPRSKNPKHIEENIDTVNKYSYDGFFNNSDINNMASLDCQYATHPKYL